VITQAALVQRLARRDLGAWSVLERIQDIALADEQRGLRRRDHRTRLVLVVHQDVPRGRGSARLDLDSFDGSADDVIDQAIALALAAIGPPWFSSPPAAPAKVAVSDDGLFRLELDAATRNTLVAVRRPPGVAVAARLEILREKLTVIASSGFHVSWPATHLRAEAVVTDDSGGHRLAIVREARRADDLDLDAALAGAAADLALLAAAGPPTAGPCAVWLGPDALLHGDDHGLWTVFAQQADAAVERRGLTRYRLRGEISPGAAQLTEPLTITSDGALDFATRSTPVADDAVAVRRFPLIERGIAVGLGLSSREAALRTTDPNGGIRNLVVTAGSWRAAPAPAIRTIEVRRLHAVSLDPTTGEASLDIALGLEHRPDRPVPVPFTGGTLHLDLVAALARAYRSTQLLRRGAYHGPDSILIDDADLLT
jgi:hypothetical protein